MRKVLLFLVVALMASASFGWSYSAGQAMLESYDGWETGDPGVYYNAPEYNPSGQFTFTYLNDMLGFHLPAVPVAGVPVVRSARLEQRKWRPGRNSWK